MNAERLTFLLLIGGLAVALSRCTGPDHATIPAPTPTPGSATYTPSDLMGYASTLVRRELAAAAGIEEATPIGLAAQDAGTIRVFNAHGQSGDVPVSLLRASLQQHGLIP